MNIRYLLFPPKCVGCSCLLEAEDGNIPFCRHCLAKWELSKTKCLKQGDGRMKTFDCELHERAVGGHVRFLADYVPGKRSSVENLFIFELKNHASMTVVKFAASELTDMIERELDFLCEGGEFHEDTVIAWVPRRTASVMNYGFDHMKRVAKALSRELSLPYAKFIGRRLVSREQKSLEFSQRRINAQRSMKIRKSADVKGKTVLLIDDIVTSGASLAAASRLLLSVGAKRVLCVTLARTNMAADE